MTVQPESNQFESGEVNNLWTSPKWSRLLRLLGMFASLFLFWLAWNQGFTGIGAALRSTIYIVVGVLIWLPWSRFSTHVWKRGFTVFCIFLFILVFAQMYEVLDKYSHLSPAPKGSLEESLFQLETGPIARVHKPRPPIDRGVMLFFILLQVPVLIFQRYPKALN